VSLESDFRRRRARSRRPSPTWVVPPAVAAGLPDRTIRVLFVPPRGDSGVRPSFLIQNLDGNGRLPNSLRRDDPDVLCTIPAKPSAPTMPRPPLSMIQRLEPRGVGARDLKECFLLADQSQHSSPRRPDHTHYIAPGRPRPRTGCRSSNAKTGYSLDIIKEAREELLHLNPRPGRDFEVAPAARNVCSRHFHRTGRDGVNSSCAWKTNTTPRLNISRKYQQLLANGQADQQDQVLHQAQNRGGAVADRVDRTAVQYAQARGTGDRRSPDGLS